jgi:transcriptional regulator with PAS, ATPase and Fis domain
MHLDYLIQNLMKTYPKHPMEIINIHIDDPINVGEIFARINDLIPKLPGDQVDVFISPGTPAMQTAWYIIGTHYQSRLKLFQLRDKKYSKGGLVPEKINVELDTSILPKNLVAKNTALSSLKQDPDYFISDSLENIYQNAEKIALTNDVGCLILGENGTGKEHLARHIHNASHRKSRKFIAVNCAAYSDDLLRSELFGHVKGSFTGADAEKNGVFQDADGGTVFLDEIGDVSLKMQVTLLRVLQEKKIQKVGTAKEIPINVRVIAATNKDIEAMCERGEFRWDLFFRLAVTSLELPPLRERGVKEIRHMINHFNHVMVKRFNRNQKLNITDEALQLMLSYGYRGNVRELENLFLHLYTFCEEGVTPADLPKRIRENKPPGQTLKEVTREHIIKVYNLQKQHQENTVKALGIARETLRKKLKEYGLLD